MKKLLFLLLFAAGLLPALHAQKPAEVNLRDAKGKPHGFWYLNQPERMGDPAYTTLGNFVHGRRQGVWHSIDAEGDLVASERFHNNTLNGESRYYERGRISVIGNYRGLNPDNKFDTLWVKDPVTHDEKRVIIPTERGALKHGLWQYFDPLNGQLVREEEYQVDELIDVRYFALPKGDTAALRRRTSGLPHNKGQQRATADRERLLRR